MPLTFVFDTVYHSGIVEAVSYSRGKEVSRAAMKTTGQPAAIRLTAETESLTAGRYGWCFTVSPTEAAFSAAFSAPLYLASSTSSSVIRWFNSWMVLR